MVQPAVFIAFPILDILVLASFVEAGITVCWWTWTASHAKD